MSELTDLAQHHQERLNTISDRAARQAVALWRRVQAGSLDAGWDQIAPDVERVISTAQVEAASLATAYTARSLSVQGAKTQPAKIAPEAFAGVTREGRSVVPELFTAVTTAKTLIGGGVGVPAAFHAGTGVMSVLAATIVRDAGRSADRVAAVGRGSLFSVRVVQPGACSRCAILAGVKGYREDFKRHPRCRCTSMPLYDQEEPPDGFFKHPVDYFDSLTTAEQDKVFTKAGAASIRLGADPAKVVNARRGALKSTKRPDGSYTLAHLRPTTIGRRADGTPLQVFSTPEGTTARSMWGRSNGRLVKIGGERYRRSTALRLMPEQIVTMSTDADVVRGLLVKYGYMY